MSAVMKLKTLQGHLQELTGFSEPKVQFEQYETPAHIAAVALYTIQVLKRNVLVLLLYKMVEWDQ